MRNLAVCPVRFQLRLPPRRAIWVEEKGIASAANASSAIRSQVAAMGAAITVSQAEGHYTYIAA